MHSTIMNLLSKCYEKYSAFNVAVSVANNPFTISEDVFLIPIKVRGFDGRAHATLT